MAEQGQLYQVWRQDDNGNQFVVESDLTREDAQKLAFELEARGHKQVYWVKEQDRTTR